MSRSSDPTAREIVLDVLEDTALVVSGLTAVSEVDDTFIRRLMRSMDVIRRRAMGRLDASGGPAPLEDDADVLPPPHPAIGEFLSRLRAA